MTRVYTVDSIEQAALSLRRGEILGYPTEAVFGLGADPENAEAVARLFALKRRDASMGFLLIAASFDQVLHYVDTESLNRTRLQEVRASWPGPHTWILPRSPQVPAWLVGDHTGIALRVTAHEPAAALSRAFGGAIISTSANRHGLAPARSMPELLAQFGVELDGILDAPLGGLMQPTSIRNASDGSFVRR